jgi:hypothetical protein
VPKEEKLNLGKGVAFVKARLKRLSLCDESWESDFQALPKPNMQNQTHYLGMVVTKKGGTLLADTTVQGRPSVNDLATLLANAMKRPLDGNARRPTMIRLRGTTSGGNCSPSSRNSAWRCLSNENCQASRKPTRLISDDCGTSAGPGSSSRPTSR